MRSYEESTRVILSRIQKNRKRRAKIAHALRMTVRIAASIVLVFGAAVSTLIGYLMSFGMETVHKPPYPPGMPYLILAGGILALIVGIWIWWRKRDRNRRRDHDFKRLQ